MISVKYYMEILRILDTYHRSQQKFLSSQP